jgi:hypothetical protein
MNDGVHVDRCGEDGAQINMGPASCLLHVNDLTSTRPCQIKCSRSRLCPHKNSSISRSGSRRGLHIGRCSWRTHAKPSLVEPTSSSYVESLTSDLQSASSAVPRPLRYLVAYHVLLRFCQCRKRVEPARPPVLLLCALIEWLVWHLITRSRAGTGSRVTVSVGTNVSTHTRCAPLAVGDSSQRYLVIINRA